MAIMSTFGASKPVVRTFAFDRHLIFPALKSSMILSRSAFFVLPVTVAALIPLSPKAGGHILRMVNASAEGEP